jgi:hypothetical protein
MPCIRPTLSNQLTAASESTATIAARESPARRARTLSAIALLELKAEVEVGATPARRCVQDVP